MADSPNHDTDVDSLAPPMKSDQDPTTDPTEELELKTVEDSHSVQRRIPTQVVRAQKALATGRQIRGMEQQLTATQIYEPDRSVTDPGEEWPQSPSNRRMTPFMLCCLLGLFSAVLAAAYTYHRDHSSSVQSLNTKATPLKIDEPSRPAPQKVPAKTKDSVSAAEQNGALERSPEPTADNSTAGLKETRRPKTPKRKSRARGVRKNPTTPDADRKSRGRSAMKKLPDVVPDPIVASPVTAASKPIEAPLPEEKLPPVAKDSPVSDPATSDPELNKMSRLRILGRKGTRIQIDMAKVGELPLPDLVLPSGRHSIWAELDGYEVQMLELELNAGQNKVLQLKLKAIPKATLTPP